MTWDSRSGHEVFGSLGGSRVVPADEMSEPRGSVSRLGLTVRSRRSASPGLVARSRRRAGRNAWWSSPRAVACPCAFPPWFRSGFARAVHWRRRRHCFVTGVRRRTSASVGVAGIGGVRGLRAGWCRDRHAGVLHGLAGSPGTPWEPGRKPGMCTDVSRWFPVDRGAVGEPCGSRLCTDQGLICVASA